MLLDPAIERDGQMAAAHLPDLEALAKIEMISL
jgi:hypothetical protein